MRVPCRVRSASCLYAEIFSESNAHVTHTILPIPMPPFADYAIFLTDQEEPRGAEALMKQLI